jgi:hypothetical protein
LSAADDINSDEVEDIVQEARHTPEPAELIALEESLDIFRQELTPPESESSDGLMDTNDTTLRRLARYADEASSSSMDRTWDETMDDSDEFFTGSEDTSGGCKSDVSCDYDDNNNNDNDDSDY